MSIIGAVTGALSIASGIAGLFGDDDNAELAEAQAARERERIQVDLKRHRRNVRRVRGEQQVQFVAAGVRGDTGSALDIIADTAAEADLDAKLIELGGEARASFADAQARQFRSRGRGRFVSGLLAGASEFLELE